MPIQVLALRDYVTKDGKPSKRTQYYNKKWEFPHLADVFNEKKRLALLSKIPPAEHYNLYFTVAECLLERELHTQEAIPFDIDWVATVDAPAPDAPESSHDDYKLSIVDKCRSILLSLLPVSQDVSRTYQPHNIAGLWSGHGVQLFLFLDENICQASFFVEFGESYKILCKAFSEKLTANGVIHKSVDTTVFSKARLMRLPGTINRKKNNPDTMSLCHAEFEKVQFPNPLSRKLDVKEHVINDSTLKRGYPPPDTKGVLAGCNFLKHCKTSQASVTEPQWYAMLSILARLPQGLQLAHEYSEGHPQYTEHETETKFSQAVDSTGPRTCEGIDSLWGKCSECPNYQQYTSPIVLKSAEYIASETTFFRHTIIDSKSGVSKPGKIDYGDLLKAFSRDFNYTVTNNSFDDNSDTINSRRIMQYKHDYWQLLSKADIHVWLEKVCNGNILNNEINEAVNKFMRNGSQMEKDVFDVGSRRYKQFTNAVLDLHTMELIAPAPELGITTIIPHLYDKSAAAPRWKSFLSEVSGGDEVMMDILEEYAAYTLFSGTNWITKALCLLGDGANGKSVYIDILKLIVGKKNFSTVPIEKLTDDYSKSLLDNKLLNACGEVSSRALRDTASFKDAVSGGYTVGRAIYEAPRVINMRAKFVLSFNELPDSYDSSDGFKRRVILLEFKQKFTVDKNGYDPHLVTTLERELPGIINCLLIAYKNLSERKSFKEPEEMKARTSQLIMSTNYISQFVDQYLDLADKSNFCKNSHILEIAHKYCVAQGLDEREISMIKIGKIIRTRFGIDGTSFKKVNGKSHRGYFGIKIKEDTDLTLDEAY